MATKMATIRALWDNLMLIHAILMNSLAANLCKNGLIHFSIFSGSKVMKTYIFYKKSKMAVKMAAKRALWDKLVFW